MDFRVATEARWRHFAAAVDILHILGSAAIHCGLRLGRRRFGGVGCILGCARRFIVEYGLGGGVLAAAQ